MSQIVIVTGGNREIIHYRHLISSLRNPYIIGCDDGSLWLMEHGERVDLAMGDFDTVGQEGLKKLLDAQIPIIRVQAEKDETDTELTLLYAFEKSPEQIIIYGGVGSRVDHSLANVHLLWKCLKLGISAKIIDPWNEIQLIYNNLRLNKTHAYVSLIPFTPVVKGITLHGFKYPLINATLEWGNSRGISNEIVGDTGEIEIKEGTLLVINSND